MTIMKLKTGLVVKIKFLMLFSLYVIWCLSKCLWSSPELSEGVEAGLICIFIELRTLNEAKVSSYIQDILRHGKKHLNMLF